MERKLAILFAVMVLATQAGCQPMTLSDPAFYPPPSGTAPTNCVINAASLNFVDVSNAVASASFGCTVQLPAGTMWWSHLISISGITLQGMGTNSTVIIDEVPTPGGGDTSPKLLEISTTTNAETRITGIQIIHGTTNNNSADIYGEIEVFGGQNNWRIDHCFFNANAAKSILIGGSCYGCIDHNYFGDVNSKNCIEVLDGNFGDASWFAADSVGGSNNVFIENNGFYSSNGGFPASIDCDEGARTVFRYNTTTNFYVNTHGTETSGRFRGSREIEVYGNTGGYPNVPTSFNNWYVYADIRGGTAAVFSNNVSGFQNIARASCYRSTDNGVNLQPWYGGTGVSNWDFNGPTVLSGTVTTTSTNLVSGTSITTQAILIDTNASWTNNFWVGCSVYDSSNTFCGVVQSNNKTNMSFAASVYYYYQIQFLSGDSYVLHKIYPELDQPGVGQSDLLVGGSPTPRYLTNAVDPIYVWSNNVVTFFGSPTPVGEPFFTTSAQTVSGRDYFIGTARPAYTPYVYPHPLDQ